MRTTILLTLTLCLFLACQSSPDREDFKTDLEFTLADCLYRSQKNPIVCDKIAERYRDWHKEKCYMDRLNYCKDINNLPKNWDLTKCLYFLNQK